MPSSGVQTCGLRSEEHTSELQSHDNLVCRLLLGKSTDAHRAERREVRPRRAVGPQAHGPPPPLSAPPSAGATPRRAPPRERHPSGGVYEVRRRPPGDALPPPAEPCQL